MAKELVEENRAWSTVKGGLIAGLVAGAGLALMMALVAYNQGDSVWAVVKFAGAPFLGERAFEPGFDLGALLVGGLSHFLVSMAWGLLFALVFYGFSRAATLAFGLLWGLVVWASMLFVVMPIAGLGAQAQSMPAALSMVEHLVFGLLLALAFLPWQKKIPQEPYRPHLPV